MKKKYTHLVKPFLVQKPPAGLYPEPRVWMEGKDLEGFNAHFSYGFIKEPCVCHPQEGALIHPFDECLVFAGTDHTDIFYLGAEIAIELGEEREEHVFTEPSAVIIPKGLPHGPVTIRKVDRPIVHYSVGLAPDYQAEKLSIDTLPPKTTGTRHKHLIKKLGILEKLLTTDPDGNSVQMKWSPATPTRLPGCLAQTLKGWRLTLAGVFTASAANGTGTAKPIPIRKKKFWFLPAWIPIRLIILAPK